MKLKPTLTLAFAAVLACLGDVQANAANSDAPLREAARVSTGVDLGLGRLVPDLEFAPVSGTKFRLSQFKSAPAVVIAFTSTSCPVTKRYAPTLAALEKEYAARGVKFVFVNQSRPTRRAMSRRRFERMDGAGRTCAIQSGSSAPAWERVPRRKCSSLIRHARWSIAAR